MTPPATRPEVWAGSVGGSGVGVGVDALGLEEGPLVLLERVVECGRVLLVVVLVLGWVVWPEGMREMVLVLVLWVLVALGALLRVEVTVAAYWVRVSIVVVQSRSGSPGGPPGPGLKRGRCRCMALGGNTLMSVVEGVWVPWWLSRACLLVAKCGPKSGWNEMNTIELT